MAETSTVAQVLDSNVVGVITGSLLALASAWLARRGSKRDRDNERRHQEAALAEQRLHAQTERNVEVRREAYVALLAEVDRWWAEFAAGKRRDVSVEVWLACTRAEVVASLAVFKAIRSLQEDMAFLVAERTGQGRMRVSFRDSRRALFLLVREDLGMAAGSVWEEEAEADSSPVVIPGAVGPGAVAPPD